jgi:cell division protein FtsB
MSLNTDAILALIGNLTQSIAILEAENATLTETVEARDAEITQLRDATKPCGDGHAQKAS